MKHPEVGRQIMKNPLRDEQQLRQQLSNSEAKTQ